MVRAPSAQADGARVHKQGSSRIAEDSSIAYNLDSKLLQKFPAGILEMFLRRHLFFMSVSIRHIPFPNAGSSAELVGSYQYLQNAHLRTFSFINTFMFNQFLLISQYAPTYEIRIFHFYLFCQDSHQLVVSISRSLLCGNKDMSIVQIDCSFFFSPLLVSIL